MSTTANIFYGSHEDDFYIIDDPSDYIYEDVNGGFDTAYSYISFAIPANVEALVLIEGAPDAINVTGNDGPNVLIGNNAANILAGLEGDDTYLVNGNVDIVVDDGGMTRCIQLKTML